MQKTAGNQWASTSLLAQATADAMTWKSIHTIITYLCKQPCLQSVLCIDSLKICSKLKSCISQCRNCSWNTLPILYIDDEYTTNETFWWHAIAANSMVCNTLKPSSVVMQIFSWTFAFKQISHASWFMLDVDASISSSLPSVCQLADPSTWNVMLQITSLNSKHAND